MIYNSAYGCAWLVLSSLWLLAARRKRVNLRCRVGLVIASKIQERGAASTRVETLRLFIQPGVKYQGELKFKSENLHIKSASRTAHGKLVQPVPYFKLSCALLKISNLTWLFC